MFVGLQLMLDFLILCISGCLSNHFTYHCLSNSCTAPLKTCYTSNNEKTNCLKLVEKIPREPEMERNQSFHWSDYLVFVFWLMIYSLVGIYHRYRSQINNFARRVLRRNTPQDKFQKSEVDDLFLSNRQLSLLPVVSSLMASFLSAVSLLGTTAESYLSGLQFICMIFAYFISFSITSEVYMPVFYKLRLSCAHEVSLRYKGAVAGIISIDS